MKTFLRIFTVCVFAFLYAPIALLIFASFNNGTNLSIFSGFTLHNYAELFADGDLIGLMLNSLLVSVLSAIIATVLGTAASIGIFRMRKPMRKLVLNIRRSAAQNRKHSRLYNAFDRAYHLQPALRYSFGHAQA